MNKGSYLKEKFIEHYGERLGEKSRTVNILSNLVIGDNVSLIEDSLKFYADKIELCVKRKNDEDEIVNGKVIIFDNARYYYLERNDLANTSIGIVYDRGNCAVKYKSVYDDFNIERDMEFKLHKNENGLLFMTNDSFDVPVSVCYPNLKEQIENNKSVSRNVGLMISDDIYRFLDFQLEMEKKKAEKRTLETRIYSRFDDAYFDGDIYNDSKIKNEMAIVYDLVNHPSITLKSISFQGKEGFDKYEGSEMANCIEINIMRNNGEEDIPGKFLLRGGKYVSYFDGIDRGIYNHRIDIIPNNNKNGYVFEYKCKDDNETGYIYNIYLNYETQMSGRGLAREYISLSSMNVNKKPIPENIKCIIPTEKYDSYHTDSSVYYLLGELVSGRYVNIINKYVENSKKKLK